MNKIRTLSEIRLKKENLRYKLRNEEKRLLLDSEALLITFNKIIITPILEKGLKSILKYFFKERKNKNSEE